MLPDPLHPSVVHFPIVFMSVLPLVAAGVAWRIHDGGRLRLWGWVTLLALATSASAWVAVRTGENEEERVEDVVAEQPLHDHEEAGERFLLFALILTGVTLVGFAPGVTGRVGRLIGVAGTVGLLWAGWQVGDLGGKLAYQHGAAGAYVQDAGEPGRARTNAGEPGRPGTTDDDERRR